MESIDIPMDGLGPFGESLANLSIALVVARKKGKGKVGEKKIKRAVDSDDEYDDIDVLGMPPVVEGYS